jgi:hypothetical protein
LYSVKKICRRCINHRINIKNRKEEEKLFNKSFYIISERNGYYKEPAQGQDGPAIEVSTARRFRGRQASSASRVTHAPRQEKGLTAAMEGFATAKEGFATYEESLARGHPTQGGQEAGLGEVRGDQEAVMLRQEGDLQELREDGTGVHAGGD